MDLYDLASKSHGTPRKSQRSITRRRWLVRVYALEQLLKYPKQGGVIGGRNTFVIKVPPRFKNSVASLHAIKASSLCSYASLLHAPPTLGAPSHRTTSALAPPMFFQHRSTKWAGNVTAVLFFVGNYSRNFTNWQQIKANDGTPRRLYFDATWHHPPGAAHKSINTLDFQKSYCLLSCVNLNAARER